MNDQVDVIAGIGLDRKTRKSHWPARLDLAQSASGLFHGLFMWGHMACVSTILISKDAMKNTFREGYCIGRQHEAHLETLRTCRGHDRYRFAAGA